MKFIELHENEEDSIFKRNMKIWNSVAKNQEHTNMGKWSAWELNWIIRIIIFVFFFLIWNCSNNHLIHTSTYNTLTPCNCSLFFRFSASFHKIFGTISKFKPLKCSSFSLLLSLLVNRAQQRFVGLR